MPYKLINNLVQENNHWVRLHKLIGLSDEIVLASPFLMTNLTDFFNAADLNSLKSFHLITTLIPNSHDQIKKTNSLVSLINFPSFRDNTIECRISINNRLHGKIYIFKNQGNYISAIISSANFTNNGLFKNHEWGVEIYSVDDIKELEKTIFDSIEIPRLTFAEINQMKEAVDEFLRSQPEAEMNNIDLVLTNVIAPPNEQFLIDDTANYWLKPIGVTGDIIQDGQAFNTIDVGLGDLNFSKLKPSGVKPGDILIAYGVGSTKLLSIYRVTSNPQYVTDEEMEDEDWYERWPWYVTGENLTPNFGSNWWTHNLHISDLRGEYLNQNEDGKITAVGGKTLGGLNFGKDKLKLSADFGIFIINRVMAIDNMR